MKNFWKKWGKQIFVFLGIFGIGVFLRTAFLTVIPVFVDEAIYIRWAQVMRAEETLRFLPLSDGKQPLFMWSVIPFLKIFSDPLVAGRIVSALSGIGTLVGVYVLTYLLFGTTKQALFSTFLYSVSPFCVFFDRLALADSMLSFFGVWTFVFSLITVKKTRLDAAIITGFCLGGALLTKSPGIYFAILIPTTLILADWPKKNKQRFFKLSVFVFLFFFTYIVAFAMYNILRLGPNFHMIAQRNLDYVYPLSHFLTSPLDPLMPFLDRVKEYFWIMGPWEIFVFVALGIYLGLKFRPKETFTLLFWAIIPILISSEFSKTMTARYVYFSVPYVIVLSSISLAGMLRLGNLVKIIKPVFWFVFILFLGHSFYINLGLLTSPQRVNLPRSERSGYLEEWTSGYGIKEISELLRKEHLENPEVKIVVGTEGYFGTLPDGLQIYLNDLPEVTIVGVGQPVEKISDSLINSAKAGNNTYLVVNSSRLKISQDMGGVTLLNSYPKAIQPDGTNEKLLFFRVSSPN